MNEKNKNIIRMILTALILLLGGYYIQQSATHASTLTGGFVDNALADTACPKC